MNEEATSQSRGPTGLGGWLILVAFGLVGHVINNVIDINDTYLPMFRDGTWELLTTFGSDAYHSLWAPLLIGELVWAVAAVGAEAALVILLFQRSHRFPTFFIVVAVANLVLMIVDVGLASVVMPDEPIFSVDTGTSLVGPLAYVLIWVPYMLVSERVKNTFVEHAAI
jgi:hypothetical protein